MHRKESSKYLWKTPVVKKTVHGFQSFAPSEHNLNFKSIFIIIHLKGRDRNGHRKRDPIYWFMPQRPTETKGGPG